MKISQDSTEAFNIIAIGSWNPAIFTPQWVQEQISDDKTKEVFIAIAMQLVLLVPPRVTVDDTNIYPSYQSLMVDCVAYAPDKMANCANKMRRVCELLPHTPLSGIGINFKFVGTVDDSVNLAELFSFGDAGSIPSDKFELQGSMVKRTFKQADSEILNFSVDLSEGQIRIDFNFHSDVKTAAEAIEKVSAERVEEKRQQALEFLQSVYGIEIDD